MLSFTEALITTVTAISVVALAVALVLLGLQYRGEEFVAWLRRNAASVAIGGGSALLLAAALTLTVLFVRPMLLAWLVVAALVLATILGALGVGYWWRRVARRRGRIPVYGGIEVGGIRESLSYFGGSVGLPQYYGMGTGDGRTAMAIRTPPPSVRTLEDLIYWQSARILSGPEGSPRRRNALAMDRLAKFRSGEMGWEDFDEYVQEQAVPDRCFLCGGEGPLTLDLLNAPSADASSGGKSAIWICNSCRSSKGSRGLYEYWMERAGQTGAGRSVPRIAEARYLETLRDLFGRAGVLSWQERDLHKRVCPSCQLQDICRQQGLEGHLSPLCLDAVASATNRAQGLEPH